MKLVWGIVIAIAASVCQVEAGRIVGGDSTTIEQYPSIVQVENVYMNIIWIQNCGGVILTSRYIVSAAHCFGGVTADRRRIRAGSTNVGSGGIISNLNWFVNHPSYGTPNMGLDGDITVAQLATPLTFGAAVQAVPIPPQGFELPDHLPVVHAGWGDLYEGSNAGSATLHDVTIYTINRPLCRQRYLDIPQPRVVTENMICAGIMDVGGKDSCQGDSGGPLYYDNILVGVVSWGGGCGNATLPGVSTRVSSYTDWLVGLAV